MAKFGYFLSLSEFSSQEIKMPLAGKNCILIIINDNIKHNRCNLS